MTRASGDPWPQLHVFAPSLTGLAGTRPAATSRAVNFFGFSGLARTLVAAAIALIPAIMAFVRGRQIARFADDPALPERLADGRNPTSFAFAFTIALLLTLTGRAAIWAIPLSLVAYVVAGLPLRRILYNETWSTGFYLSFVIRFFLAMWSFWVLVAALPALAHLAGAHAWIVALVMGAGLLVLAARSPEVTRWMIGAQPITDEAILARFHRLAATCGLPSPHFDVIDLKGGSVANAFALPSLGRSAAIFTGPLLQRLDPDETDAICAHELAHLEYYNPRRMRHHRRVSQWLVLGAAVLTPLLQYVNPSLLSLATAVWPVVVIITIVVLVHDRQKHETASDLRAVALTGNPETLVRALVKIHAIARVPRRWDADLERHMSHPSLKRRIQDIRAAAGTPPAALGNNAVFDSADGTTRAVFSDESLEWVDGESASYRVRYDRLTDLRIVATRTGDTNLLASDRNGHRWQMPLRKDDVARIQAVLDIIDSRIVTSAPAAAVQPLLIRASAFTVLIVSLNAGLLAGAMTLALALMRPEAPLVGAAGIAAVAGALLTWRDPESMYGYMPDGYGTMFASVLVVGGVLLISIAYARRRDEIDLRVWKAVGAVAAAAVASWILPILGGGIDAIGLHQAARTWPSSVVLPLALGCALLWSPRREMRMAAAVAVAASIAAASVRTEAFLDRFGGDLFLVPAPEVKLRALDRPVKEFTVQFSANELEISPGGRSVAVLTRRHNSPSTIHIGRAGETLTAVQAEGALFIDDDRALVWSVDGSRTDLREVVVAAPDARGWELRVTGLSFPAVALDAKAKRWRLVSRAGVNVAEAREGVIGSDEINSYRWSVPDAHGAGLMPIALARNRALVLEPRPDLASPISNPLGALFFVLASGNYWRSTIWALGPEGPTDLGTSRLQIECRALARAGRGACHIFDASRTRFFAMDAETRRIAPVASLPGRFFAGDDPQGSWLTGWYQSSLIAVSIDRVDAIRVAGPDGSPAHLLAVSDRAAAAAWSEMPPADMGVHAMDATMGRSTIRIYPID